MEKQKKNIVNAAHRLTVSEIQGTLGEQCEEKEDVLYKSFSEDGDADDDLIVSFRANVAPKALFKPPPLNLDVDFLRGERKPNSNVNVPLLNSLRLLITYRF